MCVKILRLNDLSEIKVTQEKTTVTDFHVIRMSPLPKLIIQQQEKLKSPVILLPLSLTLNVENIDDLF